MAFCNYCGNEMSESSGQCPKCFRWVAPHPGPRSSQSPAGAAMAYAEAPYGGYPRSFKSPGLIKPRIAVRPGTPRIVLWSVCVAVVVLIGIGSVVVRYIGSVGVAAKQAAEESAHFKTQLNNVATIEEIKSVAQTDASLIQMLNSASNQLTGTLDDQLDRKAQLIHDYVSIAQNVNTKSCPTGFVDAYRRHLSLWSDLAQALATHPHIPSEEEALIIRFLQNLAGEESRGAVERQETADWMLRVAQAEKRADQGTRDFLDAGKAAMDSVGQDAGAGK